MNMNTSITNILHPYRRYIKQVTDNRFINDTSKYIFPFVKMHFKNLMVELTQLTFIKEYSKYGHLYNYGCYGETFMIMEIVCSYCGENIKSDIRCDCCIHTIEYDYFESDSDSDDGN